jgi:hypothetical protein
MRMGVVRVVRALALRSLHGDNSRFGWVIMRILSLAAFVVVVGCTPRAPSELRPVVPAITDIPANFCGVELLFDFSLRNIGASDITLSSVGFRAAPDADDQLANFLSAEFDDDNIPPSDDGFVLFAYQTPDGVAQQAELVIVSDAEANPELVIPVSTVAFPAPANAEEICNP